MRVTCDALAVVKPIWMNHDSPYATLKYLLVAGYYKSPRTTREKRIVHSISRYRVENRITYHSNAVKLKQSG